MHTKLLSLAIISAVLFAIAGTASAVDLPSPENAVDQVGAALQDDYCTDGNCNDVGTLVLVAMKEVKKLVNIVAILIIVVAGFMLVTTQDEGHLSKSKTTLITAVIAVILINIAEPLRNALVTGFEDGTGGSAGAELVTNEILGIVDFLEEPLIAVAILMIIISGIRAIIDFGTDQGLTHIKRTIFSILAGMILIVSKVTLTRAIGNRAEDSSGLSTGSYNDAYRIVEVIMDVVRIIVTFMALAAVTVIIIAGIMMVINKGDQETVTKSKNLIIRVLIGLVVILVSYGIVFIFTQLAPGY